MADFYGPMEDDDHFGQYEDDGVPIDGLQLADLRRRMADMAARHEVLVQQLNQQRQEHQVQQQALLQQQLQQQAEPARPPPERLPECPKFGSSDPIEDAKISPKQFTVWWRKVEVWLVLVADRVPVDRRGPTIAQRLEGRAADTVWLGINTMDELTNDNGIYIIKRLLENQFYGDQAAIVSGHLDDVFSYQKKSGQTMQEFISELRTKFQLLDGRGEVMPERTRGNLLLKNSGLTESQRALVLATTQRNMTFNAVADALNLLFGDSTRRAHVDTQQAYLSLETEGRGRGQGKGYGNGKGKGKGGAAKSGPCWNCNKPGHLMESCWQQKRCFKCKSPTHLGKDCKASARVSALVTSDNGEQRGNTLTTEQRLNQLEDLLLRANFSLVTVANESALTAIRVEDQYLSAIVDHGCTANVMSEGWLRCYEARIGQQFERFVIPDNKIKRVFIFGAGETREEMYQVELVLDLFNQAQFRTTILVSVVSGSQTPLLISKAQLSEWDAIIDVKKNQLSMNLNDKKITFVCPDTKSKLMIIPILKTDDYRVLDSCVEGSSEQ